MAETSVVGKIVWHDLVTNEVDKAMDFYKKLLDWEYTEFDMGPGGTYNMIKVGEKTIGGFMKPVTDGVPSHWGAYTSVDDVDVSAERIKNLKGNIVIEPTDIPNTGKFAVFSDPQGATMCVFKGTEAATPDLPQPEFKEFCWEELMADDVNAARGFYGELFGWSFEEKDMGPMGTYTIAMRGEHQTAGIMKKPADVPAPPHWLTYIFVEDLDGTVAKVEGLGGKVTMPTKSIGMGRVAIIQDAVGGFVGLFGDPTTP